MMLSIGKSTDKLLMLLTLVISLAVTTSLPIIYVFIAYNDLSEELLFKAKIKANAQRELITTLPMTWMYAENRIQGILSHEPVVFKNEYLQVFDFEGNEITSSGNPIEGPSIQRSYSLYDIDQAVGHVLVTASLSHFIMNVFISALIGMALGLCVLLLLWFRFLSIKVLRITTDKLDQAKRQAEITLQSIHDGVLRTDKDFRLVYLNSAAEKIIGSSFSELNGKTISEIITLIDGETSLVTESVIHKAILTQKATSCKGRCSLISQDKRTIAVEEQASPIFDGSGKCLGGVLCLSDVTIIRKQMKQKAWEACHDPLTGLMNRLEFEKRLAKAVDKAQEDCISGVLCYMDLDQFKIVNDTCGHNAGDELLIQVSKVINDQVRTSDSLARLGGDEFGLILDGCNLDRGQIIARNVLNVIEKFRFFHDDKPHTIGISIGMTSINSNSYSTKDILNEADSACYWAKESGRHRICVFQENEIELSARKDEISWVERIKSAMLEDRFVLYHQTYQALTEHAGSRRHFEVLLRLVSEDGKIIPPGHFFPAAERYNLIFQIDKWVINKVFLEFQNMQYASSNNDIMVNINLSGASINSLELFDFIQEKVSEYDIETTSICFEITETVAVRNLHSAIEFINKCKKIGFKFALDDFGTGASSFSYLKNLPVDYLKIDGSFVKNIEHDDVDRAMTETINRIGHLLGKTTIAEFAENQAIIGILNDIGVDFAQGFGVCKPMPLFKEIDQKSLEDRNLFFIKTNKQP